MIQLATRRKTIITIAALTAIILVLSSFSPTVHSQTGSNSTIPCTVNTYGNAWDGALSFDLSGTYDALVVMDTNGTVINMRESGTTYGPAYNIDPDILLFEGEPQVSDPNSAWPTWATHLWNLTSDTTEDFLEDLSEHDIQYDPVNNTFLTLQDYVMQVGNNLILTDKIVQVDSNGNTLWTWDIYDHIPITEASSYNQTDVVNGQTVEDFSHANDLDWNYNDNVIYLNLRNTNTFYKINQTTGNIIWACGEFGNFTLLNANDKQVSSLWYGCHDVKEVAPDVFTIFDNDYDNNTNQNNCRSQMIELTLNEKNMTAYVNWSWEAPTQYWNEYGGAAVILPNGDYLGDFGDPTHQFPQNQPWNFNNTGAVLVEVNPAGQVVRTWTFPVGWYSYRVNPVINLAFAVTPSPTASASPTPPNTNNSQTVNETIALATVIVIITVFAALIYLRKRTNLIKLIKKKDSSQS